MQWIIVARTIHELGSLIHFSRLYVKKFGNIHFFYTVIVSFYLTLTKNISWIPANVFVFAVRWIFRVWRPGACQINKYRNRHFIAKRLLFLDPIPVCFWTLMNRRFLSLFQAAISVDGTRTITNYFYFFELHKSVIGHLCPDPEHK